jgi:hypothetical protein
MRSAVSLLWAFRLTALAATADAAVTNRDYVLCLRADHSVEVRTHDLPSLQLTAEFTVMYSARDPGFSMNRIGRFDRGLPRPFPALPAFAQRWAFYADDPKAPAREVDALGLKGTMSITVNSRGERLIRWQDTGGGAGEVLEDLRLKGTSNPYLAGQKTVLRASASSLRRGSVQWRFPEQPGFALSAEVVLPPEAGDPQIRYHLKVTQAGFYSVAFTGTPWIEAAVILPVPQETLDSGHKAWNYVISEAHVSLPRVHFATAQMNSALVVDPAESPFRLVEDSKAVWTYALAQESNSRFGLMTEEIGGRLRPVVFSPIMGGYQSPMKPGDTYDFTVRYVLRPGSWEDTYRYIARDIYRFRDMRDNSGTGPLYRTIENLMDYLSERDTANYCMWHAEQKYYNYWSDQSGIFKPFSPLFCLSAAIATDDEAFYRTRARSMVEFALSRRSNVFAPYDVVASGMVSTLEAPLGSPYVDAGQLTSLDGIFQNRTYAFSHYAADRGAGKNRAMDALAKYRATGQPEYLAAAEKQTNPAHAGFMDLLELYEETHKELYLRAAVTNAYRYIAVLNLFPAVPDEAITVDDGGLAPIHGHAYQRHEDWGFAAPRPVSVPQQTVPAWRASLIGTELSAYRSGYWLNNHAQLMRLATYANDDFLRDLQRWAMVGRFGNYAGDFRSNRHSLVAERSDAPLRHIFDANFSTFNPGHACEWIGACLDFLFSDLFNRSQQRIDFPSRCMYDAGFRVKVYGDRPGHFYDETNVCPWLPRHLLEADNPQVDYLAAHGNGKLYLAFWSQSFRTEHVNVKLNPALVDCSGPHRARSWVANAAEGTAQIADNALSFDIAPKGIVAYAIEGAKPNLGLQAKLFALGALKLGTNSLVTTNAAFGHVTAMLLTLGKGLTSSFIYTDAPAANVIATKLRFRQGDGPWAERADAIYPYEFSTDVDEAQGPFQCILEVETADQQVQRSGVITLGLN